jgi:hypothetical protein
VIGYFCLIKFLIKQPNPKSGTTLCFALLLFLPFSMIYTVAKDSFGVEIDLIWIFSPVIPALFIPDSTD